MENVPKKSLGQHWLYDEESLQAMVVACNVVPTDTIVEVGPGLGTLTEVLLATGAKVLAIEFDDTLLGGLKAKFSDHPNFELLHADILKFDFTTLPKDYKIIANIPYYLTSHLLRLLSDSANKPACGALLMQKEVTERVCAQPPDMSILAVAMQLEFTVAEGMFVPAHLFTPPPKVDSLILQFERRSEKLIEEADKRRFMQVVKAGFSAKRKTLRNTISSGMHITKEQAEKLLTDTNIDFGRRAETLSMSEWQNLFHNITTHL